MDIPITDRVVVFVTDQHDQLIPVKKIWQVVAPAMSFEAFAQQISREPRLLYFPGSDMFVETLMQDSERQERLRFLASLGYYDGPRVTLAKADLSTEVIFRQVAMQLKTLQEALSRAYLSRPTMDAATEAKLKTAIGKSQELEEKLISMYRQQATVGDTKEKT